MKKIVIAIIDSGVDTKHVKLQNVILSQYRVEYKEERIVIIEELPVDRLGHGTACAGIIHKQIPDAEILSVRIFKDRLSAKEEEMVSAIQFCIDKQVSIINCSMGIEKKTSQALFFVCEKTHKNNIFLVAAAANNSEQETYPAFFPFVFSVTSGIMKSNEWGYISDSKIKYIAKGTLQRVLDIRRKFNITGGTSLACPHLTAIIAQYISDKPTVTVENVHQYLEQYAKKTYPIRMFKREQPTIKPSIHLDFPNDLYPYERLSWMRKIAVFPVSDKEIESLIKFEKILSPIELVYAIDYPRSLKRGKYERMIKFGTSELDYGAFDTLVVGYFYEQLFEKNLSCGYELITNCLKRNIHIFSLSPLFYDYLIKAKNELHSNSIIYTPRVDEENYLQIMSYDYLPESKCPIIAVIGTGSKQGKLSTQLKIKSIMERASYNTAHLGTEPQSEILGSHFCFPIGYESGVDLTGDKKIRYLRNLIRIIEHYIRPDIIISGIQGWTITRSIISEADETTMANFLYGIQPDALVCAISPEDTIEIIEKNVQVATLFTQSKCLFYVMTPFKRSYTSGVTIKVCLNKEEYGLQREVFSKKLKLPVLDIFDDKNESIILKLITDYFS
ncbi:MAG: S8 family serine peptidase [Bacteroidales bacterium]|jgi:hypothetical protein|nr:S8 family serine peptidase [Bacteroidales bacterium]